MGPAGRKAIVRASGKRPGRACAEALAAEGCDATIDGLLPGPFGTDRPRRTAAARALPGESPEDAMAREARDNPAGRSGDPAEFGAACVFLCNARAGFIAGRNLVMDGGAFRGTL